MLSGRFIVSSDDFNWPLAIVKCILQMHGIIDGKYFPYLPENPGIKGRSYISLAGVIHMSVMC